MPIFIYSNPKTGEIREIVQSVHEEHTFVDEDGVAWNREYTVPTASIDSKLDPFSASDFARKTNTKGTLGDIIDRSKEMSIKRSDKLGYDPIQEKHYENYSKRRNGHEHNDVRKRKLKEKLKSNKWFKEA